MIWNLYNHHGQNSDSCISFESTEAPNSSLGPGPSNSIGAHLLVYDRATKCVWLPFVIWVKGHESWLQHLSCCFSPVQDYKDMVAQSSETYHVRTCNSKSKAD